MTFAGLEWRVALRKPRAAILNLVVPLALIAALPAGNAPRVHVAVVVTVLFAFFGTFGSAIPLVRDAETGRVTALIQAGAHPLSFFVQRTLASVAIDLLQLLPAALVLSLAYRNDVFLPFMLCLAGTLIAANVLGAWIAALTRSIGEAALVSSVVALALLHVGGVFRTPVQNSWWAAIEPFSPFRPLHEALRSAVRVVPAGVAHDQIRPSALIALVALVTVLLGGSVMARTLGSERR